MIKKLLILKLVVLLIFFSLGADAALKWNVALISAGVTAVVVTAAAVAAAPAIVIGGVVSVGFHASVIALYWDDINPPTLASGAPASMGVSVIINPNTPLIQPAGWTAPSVSGSREPTPPQTKAAKTKFSADVRESLANYTHFIHIENSDYSLFIGDIEAQTTFVVDHDILSNGQLTQNVPVYYSDIIGDYTDGAGAPDMVRSYKTVSCDAGYSYDVDGQCHLTDSTKVKRPSDNVCDITVAAGKFIKSVSDPDCDNTLVEGLGTGSIQLQTPTKSTYIVASTSGDVTVHNKTYNAETNITTLDSANFGSSQTLNYIQTVNTLGDSVNVNPAGTGGSGSSAGAAQDSSLNPHDGGDTPVGNGTSTAGAAGEPTNDVLSTLFNPLKAWSVPHTTGACPVGSWHYFDRTYVFDAHCTLFDEHLPTIRIAMSAFYSILALFIVLGA